MVLLPPAGITWHRQQPQYCPLATCPPVQALHAAPSPAPTHHLLGADAVQVVSGHPVMLPQND